MVYENTMEKEQRRVRTKETLDKVQDKQDHEICNENS